MTVVKDLIEFDFLRHRDGKAVRLHVSIDTDALAKSAVVHRAVFNKANRATACSGGIVITRTEIEGEPK